MANVTSNRLFLLTLFLSSIAYGQGSHRSVHTASARATQPDIERRIDSLLALMTLDEKIGQLVQYSGNFSNLEYRSSVTPELKNLIRQGKAGSLLNVFGASVTREVQRIAVEESRLGIPLLFGFDVIHGFRTTFPIPLATASSWDPTLVEQAERVAAIEASAAGIHWTFAPMVDIARDARWGRIAESSGEDPYLGAVMAAARVRGFQGADLKAKDALIACAKHFAAYGAAEGGRDYNTVDISERTLREVYLPPFKAAVEAGVGTLMSSFNEIAGVPSTANRTLVTDILRGEWKFDGLVVSDWNSVGELLPHGIAADPKEAALLSLKAGVEIDMQGSIYLNYLSDVVGNGGLSEKELDTAVRRVIQTKFKLGLFDDPYKNCDLDREKTRILSPAHRSAARDVARRSIVLLKNDKDLLPLSKKLKRIAVIGPLAADTVESLGPWHQVGHPKDVVSVLVGIKAKLSGRTNVLFAKGCGIRDTLRSGFTEAVRAVSTSDAVILVVGEAASMSGEAASRSSLDLPGNQLDLVKAIRATGKPLVVVLMNGRPLAIPWIAENVPAILETWFLGIEAGNAIADILFGDYSPSGKLPVTFPRSVGQVPVYYSHKNTGRPADDTARWTSRYIDLPSSPLYPFGFGLSYTAFEYSNLQLDSRVMHPSDSVVVSVLVTNTGKRDGEEVVQLYLRDEAASVTRPIKELKGFQRIALAAGESKTVRFTITPEHLKFYDREMQWKAEPGKFKVWVGTCSAEGLTGAFEYVIP